MMEKNWYGYHWMKSESSKIKPEFLKENIDKIINDNKIIHVIDERDR